MEEHLPLSRKGVSPNGISGKSAIFLLSVLFYLFSVFDAAGQSPNISAGPISGSISACAGTASSSPNIERFVVAGDHLISNITIAASAGFEISANATSGYTTNLTLTKSGNIVNNTFIYVRAAATAPVGNISGNVSITAVNAYWPPIHVSGVVIAPPIVNPVPNQTVNNNTTLPAINFTGAGAFNWINDTPGIGLPASGGGDIPSFTSINTGNKPITATVTVTPLPTAYAYIPNSSSNTVSVINTSTNLVVATIPVDAGPNQVLISPDGSKVYVVNTASISVINTSTNNVDATISGLSGTGAAVISPDGNTIYMASFENNGGLFGGSIQMINTYDNTIGVSFPVGGRVLGSLAISPDGRRLYARDSGVFNMYVIDTQTDQTINVIDLGGNIPDWGLKMILSPDGNTAYVEYSSYVVAYDVASWTGKGSIPIGGDIMLSPDGSKLYISNGINAISVVNTNNYAVMSSIPAAASSYGMSLSADGGRLYVISNDYTNNSGSGSVSVINTATGALIATVNVGDGATSSGNFIVQPNTCSGAAVTFTITVNPAKSNNAALANLQLSNGTLNPSFASMTTDYTTSVPNTTTSVTVTPTTSDSTASVTVNGVATPSGSASSNIPLSVGADTIKTVVTAQDGTTKKNYTVTVTRAASSNANLANLTLSSGPLTPSFSSGIMTYSASVANTVTAIAVTPTTSDSTATVTVNGKVAISGAPSSSIPLLAGTNTITTIVTAQDRSTTKTYTITVTRAASTGGGNMTSITLSSGTLSPVFTAATTGYTATVPNAITSITLTSVATERTVTVNGVTVLSESPSAAIPLAVGPNVITVAVTKLGVTTNYTITVTRALSDYALLTNLRTSSGTLSPVFAGSVFSYKTSVPATTYAIAVTPTAGNTLEAIQVNGMTVASGNSSLPIALNDGINNIAIVVMAQNGNTKTYAIAVTKPSGALNSIYQPLSVNDDAEGSHLALNDIKVKPAISPNGDGIDDFLVIEGIAAYPDNQLTIIDRNGTLVFEAKNYNNVSQLFDGHSNKNGKLQLPGTYFYVLSYKAGDTMKQQTGYIVLKY
jgi:gliding motility-associated-like protein